MIRYIFKSCYDRNDVPASDKICLLVIDTKSFRTSGDSRGFGHGNRFLPLLLPRRWKQGQKGRKSTDTIRDGHRGSGGVATAVLMPLVSTPCTVYEAL